MSHLDKLEQTQASCPPQMPPTTTAARDATPLQSAQGLVDGALDELLDKIDRLERSLDDVLTPEEEDDEGFGPISPGPRCSKAVQRAQQHEDRISRLSARVAYILARLEC